MNNKSKKPTTLACLLKASVVMCRLLRVLRDQRHTIAMTTCCDLLLRVIATPRRNSPHYPTCHALTALTALIE